VVNYQPTLQAWSDLAADSTTSTPLTMPKFFWLTKKKILFSLISFCNLSVEATLYHSHLMFLTVPVNASFV
jgi:hypothetical protein